MLGWLDRFWHQVTGTVGGAVSSAAHWAMHALASVVFAVFRTVGEAWRYALSGMTALHTAIDQFGRSVWLYAQWIIRVAIPAVIRWANRQLAILTRDLVNLGKWAAGQVVNLYRHITAVAAGLIRWVLAHVWAPLKAYADQIWNDLKKWGYTAWWYITHPLALADKLIIPMVLTFERYAWVIGRQLGTFLLALITSNLPRLATLVEDIITAVF